MTRIKGAADSDNFDCQNAKFAKIEMCTLGYLHNSWRHLCAKYLNEFIDCGCFAFVGLTLIFLARCIYCNLLNFLSQWGSKSIVDGANLQAWE